MENLVPNVSVEDIGEIGGRRAVHRSEVLRVGQVVDQLARIGFDHHCVEVPVTVPRASPSGGAGTASPISRIRAKPYGKRR
ncbi:hypothetical protein D3C77_697390 [compost metagenome]